MFRNGTYQVMIVEMKSLCNVDQLLCNVDKILTSNVMHTNGNHESGKNGNHESGDNGVVNNGMEITMVHEVLQESLSNVRAEMVESDLKEKRSQ